MLRAFLQSCFIGYGNDPCISLVSRKVAVSSRAGGKFNSWMDASPGFYRLVCIMGGIYAQKTSGVFTGPENQFVEIICAWLMNASSHRMTVLIVYPLRHLVLSSSKAVHKLPPELAMFGRRAAPDPGLGPPIELGGGDPARFIQIGCPAEILPSQRLPPKEPPPAFLQVQPAGLRRNEDQVDPWMLGQPGLDGRAFVAGEVIRDQIQLACRVVQLDGLEQAQVADRVAGRGAQRQGVPIAHPQRPVEPDLVFSPACTPAAL